MSALRIKTTFHSHQKNTDHLDFQQMADNFIPENEKRVQYNVLFLHLNNTCSIYDSIVLLFSFKSKLTMKIFFLFQVLNLIRVFRSTPQFFICVGAFAHTHTHTHTHTTHTIRHAFCI